MRSRLAAWSFVAMLSGCDGTRSAMIMTRDTKGEGRPLVLVGGGLTGWQSWIPHQERLAPTRRVSRLQPLNVQLGLDGAALPADYSVELESRALAASLDRATFPDTTDIVAWSYGALVTLDFALDHPERVRTLTLIEPPAFWVLEAAGELDERSARERDALKALHEEMRGDVTEDQLERFLVQAGFGAPGTPIRSMPPWPNWVKHKRSLLQGPAVFAHRDQLSRLKAFNRPVLLFKGTGSSYAFHRIIDVLSRTLPNARVAELPGGHAPQLAAMDAFLKTLEEFQGR
jgi:pimeloyl-ACP methyl ester carboxylesterase